MVSICLGPTRKVVQIKMYKANVDLSVRNRAGFEIAPYCKLTRSQPQLHRQGREMRHRARGEMAFLAHSPQESQTCHASVSQPRSPGKPNVHRRLLASLPAAAQRVRGPWPPGRPEGHCLFSKAAGYRTSSEDGLEHRQQYLASGYHEGLSTSQGCHFPVGLKCPAFTIQGCPVVTSVTMAHCGCWSFHHIVIEEEMVSCFLL